MTALVKFGLVLVVCLSGAVAHARPQRSQSKSRQRAAGQVLQRLTVYGELSNVQARALHKAVSKRMKRAAYRDPRDPVRAVVSRAVLTETKAKRPKLAKRVKRADPAQVRRRLRAGLDVWALEHVFAPGPKSMQLCDRGFGLSPNLCEALLAAGGGVSLAGAKVLGGRATEPEVESTPAQEQTYASIAPRAARAAPPEGDKPRGPAHSTEAPPAVAADAPIETPAPRVRKAEAVHAQAPAPAPQPREPSAADLADIARRKAEYQRQREAYLERRRAELEARRARVAASSASERVQRGPASEMEARVAGLSPDSVAKPAAAGKRPSKSSSESATHNPSSGTGSRDEVDSLVGDLLDK